MASVNIDIIEGTSASHDVIKGWDITRVAIVQGLNPFTLAGTLTSSSATVAMADTTGVAPGLAVTGTGIQAGTVVVSYILNTSMVISNTATVSGSKNLTFTPVDQATLVQSAENAVSSITGLRGSVCPNFPVQTFLQTFMCNIVSADTVIVSIKYKGLPLAVLEFDGSLNQVQTTYDINGNNIYLQYTYPTTQDFQFDERLLGKLQEQGGLVNMPVPEPIFIYKWIYTFGQNAFAAFKLAYEGKINNTAYTIAGLSIAKHCLLIEKISATTPDGGVTYIATMVFHQKNPGKNATPGMGGWDPQATFINAGDGQPPSDLIGPGGSFPSGQTLPGYTQVQVIPDCTFPTLTFGSN